MTLFLLCCGVGWSQTCFEVKVRRTMMLKLDEEGRALLPVLTPAQGSSLVQSFVYYTPRYDPPSRIASEKSVCLHHVLPPLSYSPSPMQLVLRA